MVPTLVTKDVFDPSYNDLGHSLEMHFLLHQPSLLLEPGSSTGPGPIQTHSCVLLQSEMTPDSLLLRFRQVPMASVGAKGILSSTFFSELFLQPEFVFLEFWL